MMAARDRGILHYFYALIIIVVVSAALMVVSFHVQHRAEARVRDHLERFHLRAVMLCNEALRYVREIELATNREQALPGRGAPDGAAALTADREISAALYSIGGAIDVLVALQEEQGDSVHEQTVTRAARQYEQLRVTIGERAAAQAAQALAFTLFQLGRQHSIAAEEILDGISDRNRRATRNLALAVGGVLLVAGLLVTRTLVLLRARLREHRRTEEALLDRERQLQHAAKMEALGTLVGGVAHDFNNLLTVTLGYAESLQTQFAPQDPRRESLREIQTASERAATLTRQLLSFSRHEPLEPRVVDLNLLIRDLDPLLKRLIREDISLFIDCEADKADVEVDSTQFEQVMMNLVVNARDAMLEGGSLSIRTDIVSVAAGDPTVRAGEYVRTSVEDTGCGIAPELRGRVFEPFFTTKERGSGTGLGLATVHGIVTKSHGRILIESESGRGTRFEIYLPRCVRRPLEAHVEIETQTAWRGTETVLIVEDERLVRDLAATGLREAGYRVLVADSGEDALRVCTEYPGEIELMLTDVVMPGLRGPELAERVLDLQPDIRIIFMSGYAEETVLKAVMDSDKPFVAKPFTLQRLIEQVRCELDRSSEIEAGTEVS